MRAWKGRIVPPVLALVLATATATVGRQGIAHARHSPQHGVAALPALPFLEFLALGYREVAADLCWMQTVQYYGEHRQGGNDLSQFAHYLQAVHTLDPRYVHAYLLGAVVQATDGGDLQAGLDVLRRGARANPHVYELPFHLGFLSYVVGGDVEAAAQWFRFTATYPEGRQRARRFQAFLNQKLGRHESAWILWRDLYDNAHGESMRILAAENLRRIEAQMEAERR